MGTVVAGWIAPHGVVPDLPTEKLETIPAEVPPGAGSWPAEFVNQIRKAFTSGHQAPETDAAMRAAAERLAREAPDTVVLVTPHGCVAQTFNTVSLCRHNTVDLGIWYPWRSGRLSFSGDPELGAAILQAAAESDVPATGLVFGSVAGPTYPMDWAVAAPMRYLQDAGYQGALVPVTYTVYLELENEWRFGQAIARAVADSQKRVAVIASSDLSHVHSADGPYGFDPICSEFDATIERAVRANDLRSLASLDLAWAQKAAQDGLRSILILGGAIEGLGFEPTDIANEVRDYYGMVTATFHAP